MLLKMHTDIAYWVFTLLPCLCILMLPGGMIYRVLHTQQTQKEGLHLQHAFELEEKSFPDSRIYLSRIMQNAVEKYKRKPDCMCSCEK